ncbi:N-6 DNA methylase [Haloarcula sp. K1]|uniref:N-6 DNA methylase n=1 Tax=Haloarcula sp. K1 TaxID=1622207 RepID=UPI000A842287|nr:N-6 DNA methylase [Haloarcula sp. K1]
MPYLAPYRHELRDIVKPLAEVITGTQTLSTERRFDSVLDEIEKLLQTGNIPKGTTEEEYTTVVAACRENPHEVSDEEIARAIAAVTAATKTDILGALYQLTGRTAEDDFNQYFTPPNVADALHRVGETTRDYFETPEPTVENVSGQSALGMFAREETKSARTDGGQVDSHNTEATVLFDPACGSGRLLLAAARGTENAVCLGWDIERTAARMTALTLSLVGIPGWVIGGNALTMGIREIYRIGADDETTPQCFRSIRPEEAPEMPKTQGYNSDAKTDNTAFIPHEELSYPANNVDDCFTEIERVLRHGVDQTVVNPPFDKCDLNENAIGPLSLSRFDTAHRTVGDHDTKIKSSQRYEWLILENALSYTLPSGAVSLITPTSMLGNPTEKGERQWLMHQAYLDASIELPPATFAPETTTGTSIITFVPRQTDTEDLNVDYQIFMSIAEEVGQNKDGTRLSYTDDAGTITLDTESLPRYYRGHRWLGHDTITLPDDDLYAVLKNHRDMRKKEPA